MGSFVYPLLKLELPFIVINYEKVIKGLGIGYVLF